MKIIKNIPNYLSLCNLFLGACACILIIEQPGQDLLQKINGELKVLPVKGDLNQIIMACFLILIATIIDFFDGFAARLLNAQSEIGKHLDSLADVVSFGLAPGLIMYELILYSNISQTESIGSPLWQPYIGLFITIMGAWRLAKFGAEKSDLKHFIGLPTPACAIFIIGIPFILSAYPNVQNYIFENSIILYFLTFSLGILMVSKFSFFSLKISQLGWKGNEIRYLLIVASIFLFGFFNFASIPMIIGLYIILSILFYKPEKSTNEI